MIMKQKVFFFGVLLMVLAIPKSANAYDFSYTYQGQTLCYDTVNGAAQVTYQDSLGYINLSGALVIPDSVTCNGITYSVTSIGNNAFYGCIGLTSVTIGNSVTSIGGYAFRDCSGLVSVTFNAINCTYMGLDTGETLLITPVFQGCTSLTTLTIGDNVTIIPDGAFFGCSGLTSITIPNSVTFIGIAAFHGCIGLTEITSLAQIAPTLGDGAFNNVPYTIPKYIPCGSTASYQSGWNNFTNFFINFVEIVPYIIEVQSADVTMGSASITTQPTCDSPAVIAATPNEGYRFLNWQDGNTENPREVTVTENVTYTAYFESMTQGISNIDAYEIAIYATEGRIVVRGVEGMEMRVFDVMGRQLSPTLGEEQSCIQVLVPASGVYLVKIDDLPARKVVVVR